ncbi:MAG: pilus assembly protein PilM [Bdellovibrionales bacterium]
MISVGIDIGGASVKLAEVQAASKSYSVTRFQEFPLSNDPNKDKKIEILDILRQIAAAYDPDNTKFVLALPQQHVALRYRHFPFKERFKILRSIAFELEDDIPFSQEDAIFDAKITRYIENSADVIATACPKVYIKELVSLVREAGIEPEILTIEGLALSNLLEDWQSPPPQQAALAATPEARPAEMILDIGHLRSTLVIHSEGSLITTRNIDWGGKNIADAVAQKYGLHYLEALKEMQKKAFLLLTPEGATRDQVVFSDVIKQGLEPLAQEVKFTLLETLTSRNLRITNTHLCGGTSQIKNLGPYLTQKWEVPVNRFKHFAQYPTINIDNTTTNEALSATAIGIAIEGLKRPRNPATDMLKGEFAQQAETMKVFMERWGYTAKLLGAAFCCLLVYGFLRESFAVDMAAQALDVLKSQAAAIADLKGRQASPRNVRQFVKRKKEELNARKLAVQVRELNSVLNVLAQVHQVAPGPKQMMVELRKVSIENELMELHGEVAETGSIAKFRQALENVAADGRIETVSPAINASAGKHAFGFRLKVDRRRGG